MLCMKFSLKEPFLKEKTCFQSYEIGVQPITSVRFVPLPIGVMGALYLVSTFACRKAFFLCVPAV